MWPYVWPCTDASLHLMVHLMVILIKRILDAISGAGRLPFARKIWLQWKARNGTGFSRKGVSPGPSLPRREENKDKSK